MPRSSSIARAWLHRIVARRIAAHPPGLLPNAYYAKGQYYTLSGQSPFGRLVYPVAEAGGLGVHVTLDLAGQARFGPDVVWIDSVDYTFDDRNRARFVAAIRRYYPALDEQRLQAGYTGIRPKISSAEEPVADFCVLGPGDARHCRLDPSAGHRIAWVNGFARDCRRSRCKSRRGDALDAARRRHRQSDCWHWRARRTEGQ